jgi:predicted nucleic acid-binding protein
VPVSVEIAAAAAGYRHGLGLPTVDSIVLSTFANQGCERMLTTDGHFRIAADQRVIEVEFLC